MSKYNSKCAFTMLNSVLLQLSLFIVLMLLVLKIKYKYLEMLKKCFFNFQILRQTSFSNTLGNIYHFTFIQVFYYCNDVANVPSCYLNRADNTANITSWRKSYEQNSVPSYNVVEQRDVDIWCLYNKTFAKQQKILQLLK